MKLRKTELEVFLINVYIRGKGSLSSNTMKQAPVYTSSDFSHWKEPCNCSHQSAVGPQFRARSLENIPSHIPKSRLIQSGAIGKLTLALRSRVPQFTF